MRYLGGKSKIASRIAAVILSSVRERDTYIEPFIGGGVCLRFLRRTLRARSPAMCTRTSS